MKLFICLLFVGLSFASTEVETSTSNDTVTASLEQGHKSLTFNNGDEGRKITCKLSHEFTQGKFTWSYKKEEESDYDELEEGEIYKIETEDNKSSTLKFLKLDYDQRGNYKCEYSYTAEVNDTKIEKTTEAEIVIRVKDRLAALWPFLGICLEVLILIIVIFVYEKKSKKAMLSNDDSTENFTKEENVPLKSEADTRHRSVNNSK